MLNQDGECPEQGMPHFWHALNLVPGIDDP